MARYEWTKYTWRFPTSSKISESFPTCNAFQPMWGTLIPAEESKRPTIPGITPRPLTGKNIHHENTYYHNVDHVEGEIPEEIIWRRGNRAKPGPFSSLDSKSSCSPRHMPRKGRSFSIYVHKASAILQTSKNQNRIWRIREDMFIVSFMNNSEWKALKIMS